MKYVNEHVFWQLRNVRYLLSRILFYKSRKFKLLNILQLKLMTVLIRYDWNHTPYSEKLGNI